MKNQGDSSRGTQKAIATKDHLTEVSLRLFKANGYEKTTMRQIAKEANVSLGSAYYYFQNKEEIVLFFYQTSLEKTLEGAKKIFAQKKPIETKLTEFFESKFKELYPNRNFLKILSKSAFDVSNPTSPLSEQNRPIKDKVIQILDQAFQKEAQKVSPHLRPILGSLVWHMQMGLLLYWLYDPSPNQTQTTTLTHKVFKLFFTFLGFSSLPFISGFNKSFVEIFNHVTMSDETP